MFANKLIDLLNSDSVAVQQESGEGYVYMGEYRNATTDEPLFDQVKIGFTTKHLDERATALSGGVQGPLKFVMTYAWRFPPGYAYAAEQYLHGLFDEYRQRGEFFEGKEGLLGEWAVEAIKDQFDTFSEPYLIDGEHLEAVSG